MRMRGQIAVLVALFAATAAPATERAVPYWASIAAGDALMRSGPGREYPAIWRYRRPELPLQVVQVHDGWRRVREMDGTEGWMTAVLRSAQRTAIVVGQMRPMRAAPDPGARILWRAAPGVVGRIAHCANGWCEFDVQGKAGYIEVSGLWGVSAAETID
jgi:SH3-like domain-containing protein